MEMNSTSSLDSLASNGIINFDADAYIKGTKPRYVGNPFGSEGLPYDQPMMASPFYGVTPGAHLSGHPSTDAFVTRGEEKGNSHIPWNKILAGGIIASLIGYTGIRVKEFFTKNPNKKSEIVDTFNKCKDEVGKLVKGKDTAGNAKAETEVASSAEKPVEKTVEKAAETTKNGILATIKEKFASLKNKISHLPKKVKIGGGITIGLIGLYEIYKHFAGSQNYESHE